MDENTYVGIFIGLILGGLMTVGVIAISLDIKNSVVKSKYIQCGIANYNTTSGAFEYKPQYKILGE